MIFNVPAFLSNDTSVKEIKEYPKYLATGILLDEDVLYLLIVGDFVNKNQNKISYLKLETIIFDLKDFECLIQFLKGRNLFITPHIFTKFVHLLWEKLKDNKEDYESIMNTFYQISDNIKEEPLDKKKFLEEDNFKKMKWDFVNSSLILTSKNYQHSVILTCKNKTYSICDSCGCLVIYHQHIRSAYLTNYFN